MWQQHRPAAGPTPQATGTAPPLLFYMTVLYRKKSRVDSDSLMGIRRKILNGQKTAPDFKRPKVKVGRRITKNANVTNLSFKSKRINMPSQSLGGDEGDLVSQRHLTLKVILAQLNHHNPKVRRDALHELKDIIIRHDVIVKFHLGEIVLGVVKVIIDADAVVRKSYLLLLPELFERISTHTMAPFTRLFVVYICSGLTSLDEAIRFDSLRWAVAFIRVLRMYSRPL